MIILKVGQLATIKVDPAGLVLLNGRLISFLSSDERVCTVKPGLTGYDCVVYACDGGVDMAAQVLVMAGEDQIAAEDVSVIEQDKPPLMVALVAGLPVDAP